MSNLDETSEHLSEEVGVRGSSELWFRAPRVR
jgi:hypothetical protein